MTNDSPVSAVIGQLGEEELTDASEEEMSIIVISDDSSTKQIFADLDKLKPP